MEEEFNIGIVGSEGGKFTKAGEAEARKIIRVLLQTAKHPPRLISGGCPLGGIDIWAEEEADTLGIPSTIFPPKTNSWDDGFRPRNIQIAEASPIVHVIVVARYPPGYNGLIFKSCYHCHSSAHVKSGACWTAKFAQSQGKIAMWHLVENALL